MTQKKSPKESSESSDELPASQVDQDFFLRAMWVNTGLVDFRGCLRSVPQVTALHSFQYYEGYRAGGQQGQFLLHLLTVSPQCV